MRENHPYRRLRAAFNGYPESRVAPEQVPGHVVERRGLSRSRWLDFGGREGADNDPAKQHGVERRSVLFNLPYWRVSSFTVQVNCMYACT